jgi:8-oxo-dGTP diphosphatase
MAAEAPTAPPLYALSSAVFVQREGRILVLRRAGGEMTGGWYLPGGALDAGETIEECARRELYEECGLVPSGPLTCVGVAHMRVYGYDSLQVLYACDCTEGEVVLSVEHDGARWVDAAGYRERYFNDAVLARIGAADARIGEMLLNIRNAIDAYIEWRSGR